MPFSYFPLAPAQVERRSAVWQGLAARRPPGRAAVCGCPKPDAGEVGESIPPEGDIPLRAGGNPEWDREIRRQVRELHVAALSRYPDDSFPSIAIPRPVHGQTQAIAEVFGCRLLEQSTEPGLFFPVPSVTAPGDLDHLHLKPLQDCLYGQAVDFARYAAEATSGALAVRNPVMTGPIDTANYVLGSMRLMEWIYDERAALHRLLGIITDVIVDTVHRLQAAAGRLCPDHCVCLDHGFNLCSEVRDFISADAYAEFESPYLRRIGRECGPYMIHGCGTWERTIPLDLQDENLMMIHFQTKEMNLAKVHALSGGHLSLYVGRSVCLSEKYLWPDEESFYRHLMTAFPEPVPLAYTIGDAEAHARAQLATGNGTCGMFLWKPERG